MSAGYVFEALDKNSGELVAVKRTHKVGNVVSREYKMLKMLQGSPNVVQLVDLFYTKDGKGRLLQNTVMEFCEYSLEKKLRENMKND